MRSPAPRGNAENRAQVIRTRLSIASPRLNWKVNSRRSSSPGAIVSSCLSLELSSSWRILEGRSDEWPYRFR
jgi:hypothetical protein